MRFTRRKAMQTTGAGLAAAFAGMGAARAQTAGRPNILWLVSEDNNPFIGAYGDPVAHTPNIDALARRGVLYRNAFATAPVCAPSRFAILTGVYPEACAPAQHMRATARLPEALRTYPDFLREAGYYCANNWKTDYNCDVDAARLWHDSSASAHWRNRAPGQPFFSIFNYMTTHESQLFRTTEGRVTPAQIRLPAYLPDTPGIRTDFASYYNLMERMDAQLGGHLAELEADGVAEDTIVFYYSDHGGVLSRSKRYCYEEGLRCALVVYVPEKWAHLAPGPAGTEIEAPVSLIDLAPTLLSLIGARPPATMQGAAFMGPRAARPRRFVFGMRNRMDERYDFVRTVRDQRYRYIRNYMPHREWGMHGAYEWQAQGYQDWEQAYLAGRLTPAQAQFFGPKPYEEFYDLDQDPDEVNNLIASEALAAEIDRFRAALDRHMLAINDNGFIPEGASIEGYDASRARNAYPLRRIMRVAEMAAQGHARHLGELQQNLSDPNEVVRYWAATGLLIRGAQANPALASLRQTAETDPSLQTRVVAAEAAARAGDPAFGAAKLAALLDAAHAAPVRLMALNALTEIGEAARPALPAIKAAAADSQEYIARAGRYLAAVLEGRYSPDLNIFGGPGLAAGAPPR